MRQFLVSRAPRAALRSLVPGFAALADALRCERGSITTAFAASATVMILVSASAIDVGRVYSLRSKMQSALDAATLAGARSILIEQLKTKDDIEQRVGLMFENNLVKKSVSHSGLKVQIAARTVHAETEIVVETPMLAIAGITSIKTQIRSTAAIAETNLEMSLVVDTTGSIRINGHAENVKSALSDLVNDLERLAPKLSLVPFSETVNLGPNRKLSWIDTLGLSPTHGIMFDESKGPVNHMALFLSMGMQWKNCVEMRPIPYDVTDDPASIANPSTLFVPFFGPAVNPFANYLKSGYQTVAGVSVVRNPLSYTAANFAKVADPGHPGDFYDPNANCNRNHIIPLTTNYGDIRSAISNFDFDGGTNIASGLAFGFHTLAPGEPFAEAAPYSPSTRKVMVLFTDGKNDMIVESNGYGMFYDKRLGQPGNSWTGLAKRLDDRMDLLCANIKKRNITLYIISYALPDTAAMNEQRTRMDACASSPDKHFDAKTPELLRAALVKIVESETPVILME